MTKCSVRVEEQDRDRRSLHAARRGAGGAADQHEDYAQQLSALRKLRVVGGVEAGRSCGDRLEKRRQDPFPEGEARVLDDEKSDGRKEDQDRGSHQDHFGLETILVKPELIRTDVFPGPETETAQNDQRHDDQIDRNASGKAGKGGKLFGSVTSKEIAAELKNKYNITVDKRKIVLDSDIKSFGTYNCEVKLYTGVSAKLKVMVTEEETK